MAKRRFISHALEVIFAVFFLPGFASAANIQIITGDRDCEILLSGVIQDGDLGQLQILAERSRSSGDIFPRLCLDSEGGSFLEAVEIAEFIYNFGVSTVLRPGDRCLSACSWIFMFGTERWDDEPISRRTMSVDSQLGFHALALHLPEVEFMPRSEVEGGFEVLIEAFARLLELGNIRHEYTGRILESDLVQAAMATPGAPDHFYYIDDVDKIGRWGIGLLEELSIDTVSPLGAHTICLNASAWRASLSSVFYDHPQVYHDYEGAVSFNSESGAYEVVGPRSGMRGHSCTVWPRRGLNGFDVCVEDEGLSLDWCGVVAPTYAFLPSVSLDRLVSWELYEDLQVASGVTSDVNSVQCWLSNDSARVANVNEYVNLRARPNFSARVLRELPLGELVRVLNPMQPIGIGDEFANNQCLNACRSFANRSEQWSATLVQQCINDHILWYEVLDTRGNQGWVSRRFLVNEQ